MPLPVLGRGKSRLCFPVWPEAAGSNEAKAETDRRQRGFQGAITMPQRWNAQTVIISGASGTVSVFTNPSKTAFAYVWKLQLTCAGPTLLTFNNSTVDGVAPLSGALDLNAAGGSCTKPESNFPHYTIDPQGSFTITNSGAVQLSGDCTWSN